jgi:hypothetical protein
MKKIFLLFLVAIVTSISSFAYTVSYSLYNYNGVFQQKTYTYYLNKSSVTATVYAQMQSSVSGSQSCAAQVYAKYQNSTDYLFVLGASASPQSPSYLHQTYNMVITRPYILTIFLQCPLRGDYASAVASW